MFGPKIQSISVLHQNLVEASYVRKHCILNLITQMFMTLRYFFWLGKNSNLLFGCTLLITSDLPQISSINTNDTTTYLTRKHRG